MAPYVGSYARLTIPEWVPASVADEAHELHRGLCEQADPDVAATILTNLVVDPRMRRVWSEILRKKRQPGPEEFVTPAAVTAARKAARLREKAEALRSSSSDEDDRVLARVFQLEAEDYENLSDIKPISNRDEQCLGARRFFNKAYRDALHCEPTYLSDVAKDADELTAIAVKLRELAVPLRNRAMLLEAKKLVATANAFDRRARRINPYRSWDGEPPVVDLSENDAWVIQRHRGDPKMRTFIAYLCMSALNIFDTPMYSTVATVANVVFQRNDVTRTTVRDIWGC